MTKLRIAVVGAGVIGRTHIQTLQQTADLVLSAVIDPAIPEGSLAGAPVSVTLEDALGRCAIDGVIIAAPNDLHRPLTEAALAAGKPVLLEKPVANDLADGRALIAAAQASGVPVLVGHHRRHNPIVRAAKSAIDEGVLGDLVAATVMTTLPKPPSYFDVPWRSQPRSGGPLAINAIHEIDLLRHFWGPVRAVSAMVSTAGRNAAVEDSAAILLAFQRGGLATITLTDLGAGPWAWDLSAGENPGRFPAHDVIAHAYSGTRAALSLPDLALWRHPGAPDWTQPMRRDVLAHSTADPYVAQLGHFADVIRGKCPPAVTLAEGVANMAVVAAIKRSGETGALVAVEGG